VSARPAKSLKLAALQDSGLPLSEAVFRALREAIREGILRPGDRLREVEVAQQLGVSRTPVREAFGRLVARRLIESSGGQGLTVRRLDLAEIRELYSMREILEGAAAALAAQHASKTEIDVLLDLEGAFESKRSDAKQLAASNKLLHETIFRAARNRYLDLALQDIQDGIALLGRTTFSLEGRPKTAGTEHRDIITAIANHDAEEAERAARAHIRASLRARLQIAHEHMELRPRRRP
jgi:DNA-binding GntR family transcriptional regulator